MDVTDYAIRRNRERAMFGSVGVEHGVRVCGCGMDAKACEKIVLMYVDIKGIRTSMERGFEGK